MIKKPTRIIRVANKDVAIPLNEYRKAQSLIRGGCKLEAVAILRRHARVELRTAKAAVENPENFEQTIARSATPAGGLWRRALAIAGPETFVHQWMTAHPSPALATLVAVVVLSVTLVTTAAWDPARRTQTRLWYYDLNSAQLFPATSQWPTIDAPGAASVRAYVLTCGQCTPDEQFIGFLERYTDAAHRAAEAIRNNASAGAERWAEIEAGRQIRAIEGQPWVAYDSPEGRRLRVAALQRCGETAVVPCYPN